MKTYLSPDNKLYAYEEDGSQDHLIPFNFVRITEAEAQRIRQEEEQQRHNEYINSLTYADLRKLEYPPFENYLDGIVKGDQVQIQNYIDACLAIKAKYPKPE